MQNSSDKKPSVIVYGPAGGGKTVNAERLRKHFGMDTVVDQVRPRGDGRPGGRVLQDSGWLAHPTKISEAHATGHLFLVENVSTIHEIERLLPDVKVFTLKTSWKPDEDIGPYLREGTFVQSRPKARLAEEIAALEVDQIQVKFKRLTPTAKVPTYATEGAACFDFYVDHIELQHNPALPDIYHTGIAVSLPPGWRLDAYSRSGFAKKHGLHLANGVGKIDTDYRGEICLLVWQPEGAPPLDIKVGDRIAQGEVNKVTRAVFVEVDELDETARGEGGFGHTGA